MAITFQLLLYTMKVTSQEDQLFCSLNFSDVTWKPPIRARKIHLHLIGILKQKKQRVNSEVN